MFLFLFSFLFLFKGVEINKEERKKGKTRAMVLRRKKMNWEQLQTSYNEAHRLSGGLKLCKATAKDIYPTPHSLMNVGSSVRIWYDCFSTIVEDADHNAHFATVKYVLMLFCYIYLHSRSHIFFLTRFVDT